MLLERPRHGIAQSFQAQGWKFLGHAGDSDVWLDRDQVNIVHAKGSQMVQTTYRHAKKAYPMLADRMQAMRVLMWGVTEDKERW